MCQVVATFITLIFSLLTFSAGHETTVSRHENPRFLCQRASTGCGTCLKAHLSCAWCSSTTFNSEYRCDTHENLQYTCAGHVVSPKMSDIQLIEDAPVGSRNEESGATIQFQPQVVELTMKPGEKTSFLLKYLHSDSSNNEIYLLNSETAAQGLHFEVANDCSMSQKVQGDPRNCQGVKLNDIITFNLTLTLTDCLSSGDIVASVGIGGVREILAVYVTPSCGCDCEKLEFQETQSPSCSYSGNLICGKCVCYEGKHGAKCEFEAGGSGVPSGAAFPTPSPTMTVNQRQHNVMDVDNCKMNTSLPDCSGRGYCLYGQCVCDKQKNPEAIVYGKYCECDNFSCPRVSSTLCNGKGVCECGRCMCNDDWVGHDCSCSQSNENCISPTTGFICNNAGACTCNECMCSDQSSPTQNEWCEPIMEKPQDRLSPYDEQHPESKEADMTSRETDLETTNQHVSQSKSSEHTSSQSESTSLKTSQSATSTQQKTSQSMTSVPTSQLQSTDLTSTYKSMSKEEDKPTSKAKLAPTPGSKAPSTPYNYHAAGEKQMVSQQEFSETTSRLGNHTSSWATPIPRPGVTLIGAIFIITMALI